LRRVVWQKLTDVSEMLAASIMTTMSADDQIFEYPTVTSEALYLLPKNKYMFIRICSIETTHLSH
jgi:hypothetical protein